MNVLVTGSKGFVGMNVVTALKNLRNGNDKTRPNIAINEIFEYDIGLTEKNLEDFIGKADFVLHFAGVNRPKNTEDFAIGNADFTKKLTDIMSRQKRPVPILFSSSVQAALTGRYEGSPYGKSKLDGENTVFDYSKNTGSPAFVFRFPNIFGKWARPNYNSAVATFCHNIARGLEITVNDRDTEIELIYIDDLVNNVLDALENNVKYEGKFAKAWPTHRVTLGKIADTLYSIDATVTESGAVNIREFGDGSFEKKLCSTFLSYLPAERLLTKHTVHEDSRGSFTELFKTENCGQFSVNVTRPGVTKGDHFHNSKWEYFTVVAGEGRIKLRNICSGETSSFDVNGREPVSIRMLPGYTHSIENTSKTEDLVTIMWANEKFDPEKPDTFYEKV